MNAPKAVRILIVDVQAMFREGLRALLESEPGFHVIADTNDCDHAYDLVIEQQPDILLIDVTRLHSVSGRSGLQALHRMTVASPHLRPILMTSEIDDNETFEALKSGVRGVLRKESGISLFVKCIRTVMAGGYWISRGAVAGLVANFANLSATLASRTQSAKCSFSKREMQVLRAIIYGYTNKDIAQELALSEQAVKYHLTKMFRKVGVTGRMELARFTIDHKLIET